MAAQWRCVNRHMVRAPLANEVTHCDCVSVWMSAQEQPYPADYRGVLSALCDAMRDARVRAKQLVDAALAEDAVLVVEWYELRARLDTLTAGLRKVEETRDEMHSAMAAQRYSYVHAAGKSAFYNVAGHSAFWVTVCDCNTCKKRVDRVWIVVAYTQLLYARGKIATVPALDWTRMLAVAAYGYGSTSDSANAYYAMLQLTEMYAEQAGVLRYVFSPLAKGDIPVVQSIASREFDSRAPNCVLKTGAWAANGTYETICNALRYAWSLRWTPETHAFIAAAIPSLRSTVRTVLLCVNRAHASADAAKRVRTVGAPLWLPYDVVEQCIDALYHLLVWRRGERFRFDEVLPDTFAYSPSDVK